MESYSKMRYLLVLITFVFALPQVEAQRGSEYIYGKITTRSGEQYIGFMRWGKQEFFWHDIFNSSKVANKRFKSPNEKPSSLWDNFSWNLSSIWEDKYRSTAHLFTCFYGDIKAIYPDSDQKVNLELKNGEIIKLNGGSDDIGTSIYIYDFELGKVKIRWDKIYKIEFSGGPDAIHKGIGKPLYGRLKTTRKGIFEGYIKWDLEERTTEDILDGNGDKQIAFKNIQRITKSHNGVNVSLNSGREIYLTGSNDVNSTNRGIAVYLDGVGSVKVSWKDFKYVEFFENPYRGPSYNDFEMPIGLEAEVYTVNDEHLAGLMVYDVDEKWEIEFIDGLDDNIEYQIPLRNVKTIVPKNKTYTQLYLKCGEVLLLGEGQDVSQNNDGILLFIKGSDKPRHLKWRDIIEINIK